MNPKALNARHIWLIGLYWSRHAVRSGAGLVYLLIALIFGLSVAHMVIMPVEQLMTLQKREMGRTNPEAIRSTIVTVGQPVLRFVLGLRSMQELARENSMPEHPESASPSTSGSAGKDAARPERWTNFLLEERPALLSLIFLVLVFGMPFAISFLAFNQVTGDIQSHGLRYLLLRTERGNIYLGRFLGTAAFSTAVMAVIVATITLYLGLRVRLYPAGALAAWAAYGFLALALLMLPYIAVCSILSASVDSPFLSLVLAKLVIGGVLLFSVLGGLKWEAVKLVKYALPWGWQNYLLHPEPSHWFGAGLACLLYTAVFLVLGYARFETRDL
jgi:ABC-type transport system involved in multi-copper enzyme maturation permease subunit